MVGITVCVAGQLSAERIINQATDPLYDQLGNAELYCFNA